jgi:hypothetical protein
MTQTIQRLSHRDDFRISMKKLLLQKSILLRQQALRFLRKEQTEKLRKNLHFSTGFSDGSFEMPRI